MSELEEFRKDLDDLRDRVIQLELQARCDLSDVTRAVTTAKAAERHTSGLQAQWRHDFAKTESSLAQIIALLRVALNAPAET
ncbi:MAG TPA: hypothetical protein VGS60_16175 [Actinomycetes bacterium]|jgi:hypothetical protein|nr:hypothetical protein [Actinomycetes bacterium]